VDPSQGEGMASTEASNLPCSSRASLIGEREKLDLLEKSEEFQKIGSCIFSQQRLFSLLIPVASPAGRKA
jgi:hypothetical protein